MAHPGRAGHPGSQRGRGDPAAGLAGVGCGCGGPMEWPAGMVSPLNIPAWRAFPLRDRLRSGSPGSPCGCITTRSASRSASTGGARAGAAPRARHGRLHRRGRRAGAGRPADRRRVRQRRPHRPRRGRPGRAALRVRRPGLPGGDRPRPGAGRLGPGAGLAAGPAATSRPRTWPTTPRRATRSALAAMRRAGRALGIAIASATHLCDLEVVAVGGGLSQAGSMLFDPLEEALRAHAGLDFARQVRWCRPRSARARGWSARRRCCSPPTGTGRAGVGPGGCETAGMTMSSPRSAPTTWPPPATCCARSSRTPHCSTPGPCPTGSAGRSS